MAIQQLCYFFSCNLVQSRHLHQPANAFNIVLHWLKSCEDMHKLWEKFAPHAIPTVHGHFLPSCILLKPFKMSNECQQFWEFCLTCPKLSSFPWRLGRSNGLLGLLLPPGPLAAKWYGVWRHVNNTVIQRCSGFSKVCRMARGIVKEKKRLGWQLILLTQSTVGQK